MDSSFGAQFHAQRRHQAVSGRSDCTFAVQLQQTPTECMELWGGLSFTDPWVVEGCCRGISTDTETDYIERPAAAHGQTLEQRTGPGCLDCRFG